MKRVPHVVFLCTHPKGPKMSQLAAAKYMKKSKSDDKKIVNLFTKRSRSRVLSASLLWHKQHIMPEPAFALFYLFFFFSSQFRHSPCLVGRCAVLGLEKLLPLPFYIAQYPSKSRDNTFNVNTTLSLRFSLSLALAQLLSPFLSLPLARSVTPLHNGLPNGLPTHINPFPTSLYDQLCYISKI
ncbi:hypothetical protein ALC56_00856 [Trachymyrmex septentrionalis]|uniref:Uncharacterized protein n=1 Tax=Trachymyrmex septentrionalis TaxID=34720 RepID=A0A195FW25_9HYME|nr:hypothetical protein ALC56_00856 [Trachymyrmex septentrionalis]